jgi:hypothetical protein
MALEKVPESILQRYRLKEYRHASGVLQSDFADQWMDIIDCLGAFTLRRSWITVGGGGRSKVSRTLDDFLAARGWQEEHFDIKIVVDGEEHPTPTHKIGIMHLTNPCPERPKKGTIADCA